MNFYIHIIFVSLPRVIFRETIFLRKSSVSSRYLIAYPPECHSGPRGHFDGRRAFPSTGSVADGTLAKSRIHLRVFEMGAKQSGCKFDWRHRLRAGYSYFRRPRVGVSDTVGRVWCPPARSPGERMPLGAPLISS